MRPKGSPEELERRRHRAVRLVKEGLSLHEVARRIGCHASSVMRWRDAAETKGPEGLEAVPAPGRPPKLKPKQKKQLEKYLLQGPLAHGWRTDLWTTQRIADLIRSKFGVPYHRDHIGRLMRSLGWSPQKPERRAIERDDQAIKRWKRKEWPRVKKTLRGWAPTSCSSTNRDSS
jgi:transposase